MRLRFLSPNPSFLRPCFAFDQHLQIKLFGGQTLESILANGAKAALIHIFKQAILKIGIPKLAGIIITQDAFNMG